jgi:hypothetical protein
MRRESVVRIRTPTPDDGARCRRILETAGLVPEQSLTWIVVRDRDPDEVNALLVAGGALGRVAAREGIAKLVGWLIDRQGALEGRERNVKALVERVLSDAGLAQRYAPKPEPALRVPATALYEELMAEGAPFLPWERFLEMFCEERAAPGG